MIVIKSIVFLGLVAFAYSCNNFGGRNVRVAGDWSAAPIWNGAEPAGLMKFDSASCLYTLSVVGLKPNFNYQWKITIGDSWGENYGCSGQGGPNCFAMTSSSGSIRFLVRANTNPPQLSTDHNVDVEATTTSTTTTTTTSTTTTTTTTTGTSSISNTGTTQTPLVSNFNPIKPCNKPSCPACNNVQSSKLVRASGDWPLDLGSTANWLGDEPYGLMTFDENICQYTLILTGLKANAQYKWKITMDNAWKENYGCSGANGPDCSFKSNSAGAIRLVVKPGTPPQLSSDFNIGECGNNICEAGETCGGCPEDCGECVFVCGDGVCDEGETPTNCPSDCPNELPGCERFNDESCKSGSQFHANEGVGARRWQTPKPGRAKYQPSYQHMHTLVGYADIRYTSPARTEADVCIVATHRQNAALTFIFNGAEQSTNCRRFSQSHSTSVELSVTSNDGSSLVIAPVHLAWNSKPLLNRNGDYRNGQKGGVVEFFGWPHKDVEKECELLGKAGYLGAKLFPIHEQLMSAQPFNDVLNPWYFMYQPVSYTFDGRAGTREELKSLIDTCRSRGVRIYADAVLNHFTGAGNDMLEHRNPSAGCAKWGNKSTSAPIERQSPFYTHAYTYQYNENSGQPPSNEFPGAAIGPEDFHCDRSLGSWSDLFILNNGWLVGLTDLDTSRETVRERQAAYLVEMLSMGISGFRIDAAKHISPEDLAAILQKVQAKMGGKLPDDFFTWLEILTGGEAQMIWSGPSWYGSKFEGLLNQALGSASEVEKVKMWDGLYPKEPHNNPLNRKRVVIQNDDHDQQSPGSSSRDMAEFGCVLVKDCSVGAHRNFETKLFNSPFHVSNNAEDWPIRFVLSSYYHYQGREGVPDGLSDCSLCKVTCQTCKTVPFMPAYEPGACAYTGSGYTRVHRDIAIINAMRSWIGLGPISGGDIGLPNCS